MNAYMAAHPNVKINLTTLENAALKQKHRGGDAVGQPAGPVPVLGRRHARAAGRGGPRPGRSTTRVADVKDKINAAGHEPGPTSMASSTACHTTSAWSASGTTRTCSSRPASTAPPATWDELLTDVQTFKDKGIVPISLAAGAADSWTAMFWWAYLSTRICGAGGIEHGHHHGGTGPRNASSRRARRSSSSSTSSRSSPGSGAATHPAQEGEFGNGKAAMMLQGQWACKRAGVGERVEKGHR